MIDHRLNILYVDDEQSIIEFVKILFKKYELSNITYAKDGQEALDLYKNNNGFDLIFTDMIMPKMDGFELIEKIKEINNEQIIVMVTGMEDKKDLVKAIELEVKFFVEKPIKPKKFQKILNSTTKLFKERRENELANILLQQYKHAIDKTTILSKSDTKGIITYVNEQFCRVSKYEASEVIGKPHNILRHPDMPKETYKNMWETITSKKTWHGTVKNKAKDGSSYIVEATIIPILDTNGNILEYIGIRYDVTELENYKEALQHQLEDTSTQLKVNVNYNKQYQKGLDRVTAIFRTDTENIITFVNDNFCKLSGFSRKELLGVECSTLRDDSHIIKGDCEMLKGKLRNKEMVSIIFTNIAKNGQPYYIDTIVYPIEDVDGHIVEHMHIMHDITELVQLNQEIEDTQKEVVFTMGAIGETRSKETGNHVKRVAEYSYILAKLYGLEEDEAELIKMASPMHDIGKVGIPDSILNKPARLTAEEFGIMKSHSQIGYDMLKGSNRSILKASSIIALEHHERWDGRGYPNGKKGEEIHIYGRITSICDVFDALGSDRCYKKAWELEKILQLFRDEHGKQFDPNLTQLFLDNLDEFLKIRDQYKD